MAAIVFGDRAALPQGWQRARDGTTLLKFRRLPENNKLGEELFAKVGEVLQERGLKLGTGTIVDATIIAAPSSTKNADPRWPPKLLHLWPVKLPHLATGRFDVLNPARR